MTAASGDVATTGIGFTPSSIICLSVEGGDAQQVSWGLADSTKTVNCFSFNSNGAFYQSNNLLFIETTDSSTYQKAIIKSYDSDGFTLTWTKSGSPTGTTNVILLCLR
jgi:hypothetical protein